MLLYPRARAYLGLPVRRVISWDVVERRDGTATVLIRSFRDGYVVNYALRDGVWELVSYWVTDS